MYTRLFSAIILIAVLLCGCQQTPSVPKDLVYEDNVKIVYDEPHGEAYAVANGVQTEYGGITYSFHKDISIEDRHSFIQSVENVIFEIENRFGDLSGNYEVRVRKDDYRSRAEGNILYIGIKNVESLDFVIGVTQMVFGMDTNYGILYGLAADIARDLGYVTEEPGYALSDALELYDSNPIYLDMNYACFLEDYADAETLGKVKSIACGFYDFLIKENKTDLFTDYSNAKYCSYLSEFLTANGKGSYDNSDLAETRIYSGGQKVRLAWETPYGVFYLRDDYVPKYGTGFLPKDLLSNGYENLRKWIVGSIVQAEYMEQHLGGFDEAPEEKVDVVFLNDPIATYGAAYFPAEKEIQMLSLEAFLHEYGHYLLRSTGVESWHNEAVCYYFTNKPVDPQTTYLWYTEMLSTEELDPNKPEDALFYEVFEKAKEHLDHEFDWTDPDDYFYQNDAYVVALGFVNDMKEGRPRAGDSMARASFVNYLAGIYGEESAVRAFVYDTPEETLGKSWDALIADWENYLATEFAWAEVYQS